MGEPIAFMLSLGTEINGVQTDRVFHWIDKTEWGRGPWDDEPDKVQWVDRSTLLDCLVVRHSEYGHFCFYVGVPEGHPCYGVDHDNLPSLDAHGGVTYAAPCQENTDDPELIEVLGVCHVAQPGRPEKVWWIGGDCAHAWDVQPARRHLFEQLGIPSKVLDRLESTDPWRVYRDVGYVMGEAKKLALQLLELEAEA